MSDADALLMLSGGLDSVRVLYDRCRAGLPTRTHHVRLRNWERREGPEAQAVHSVLEWLNRKYPGLIEHTESGFDYGDLRYIVRDHNIWGLVAGIVLANPRSKHISKLLRTFHRDSVVGGAKSAHGQAAGLAWSQPVERLAKRPIEFMSPIGGMTKAEIIEGLPAELLELCWWCRRPRGGQPCHECHTCRQVDAALAGEPWVPLDERGTQAPAPVVGDEAPAVSDVKRVWVEYASKVGVEVDSGWTKKQIMEAVNNVVGATR